MTRKGSSFAGLSVAIVTPFRDGKLDKSALREQIEFQLDAGTDCLVPVGTTGESPTLTHPEHEEVISEVIQLTEGRAKVMAGTGSNSTAEAISLTQWAANEGADATLQVAPYYNKPTQEGLYQHYKAVSEASRHPDLCLQYSWPDRSQYRAGDDCPNGRARQHYNGQGSDRINGPGIPGLVDDRLDRAQW